MWNTIPPPHGSKPDPHLVHVEHSTRTWNMSGRALEFISADQKPSLFNNIGTQCQLAKKGNKDGWMGGFQSMDPKYNPDMFNWNQV